MIFYDFNYFDFKVAKVVASFNNYNVKSVCNLHFNNKLALTYLIYNKNRIYMENHTNTISI